MRLSSAAAPAPVDSEVTERGLGIYRQARLRTTAAAVGVLLIPFLVFYFFLKGRFWDFAPALKHPLAHYLTVCVFLGLVLALVFGRIVSNHILILTRELEKTTAEMLQRQRERDSAQAELIHHLHEERELVKAKHQFEAQLAQYEKYAALAQLALGAAHEINNPLLGISSHLELELKDTKDPEHRIEIEQCLAATDRISSTINGLINYARPGPLQLTKVHLDALVTETLNFLAHQPLFRRINLQKKIPADLPAITADAQQISQVLMNLLLNAGQAMPEGGSLTVSAEKVKFAEKVELKVTDTGEGIPAEVLPHIFEPFFTTKRGKATGLGLSISQAYIRSHSGEMTADSRPGEGTTVRVVLPIRQEGKKAAPVEEVLA